MALQARLYPDRVNLLPNALGHRGGCTASCRASTDSPFHCGGNTRHGKTPRPAGDGAAAWCCPLQRRTDAGTPSVHASKGARRAPARDRLRRPAVPGTYGRPTPRACSRWISCGRTDAPAAPSTCVTSAPARLGSRPLPSPPPYTPPLSTPQRRRTPASMRACVGACIGAMPLRQGVDDHLGIGVPIIRVLRGRGRIMAASPGFRLFSRVLHGDQVTACPQPPRSPLRVRRVWRVWISGTPTKGGGVPHNKGFWKTGRTVPADPTARSGAGRVEGGLSRQTLMVAFYDRSAPVPSVASASRSRPPARSITCMVSGGARRGTCRHRSSTPPGTAWSAPARRPHGCRTR